MDERLKELDSEQLIDVIVNYQKYNYSETTKDDAFRVLKSRKIPKAKLDRLAEKLVSRKREVEYDKERLRAISKRYKLFAAIAMTGYFPAVFLFPLFLFLYSFISGESVSIVFPFFGFGFSVVAVVFHILAMNKLFAFRAIVDGENGISLIQYVLFYAILFSVSPAIIIYNLFYMKRSIRDFGV